MAAKSHNPFGRSSPRPPGWQELDDEDLMQLRFRQLHLKVEDSLVWPEVQQLDTELERRAIRFQPHVWFSEEWFSPDGVPGIAIPFYLAHPRLKQIERRFMGAVEGGSREWPRHPATRGRSRSDTVAGVRRRADPRQYRCRPGGGQPC